MAKTTMTYSDWRDYKKKNAANQIAQLSQQGTVNNGGTTANTTITYSDWRDYKKASQVDQNYIDSFFTDAKKFVYSSEEEYQGIRWKNASGIYKVKKTTVDDLDSRSKNIRSWLELNKDTLTEDSYTNISSYLDDYNESAKSILSKFEKKRDYYAKWKTEAEYKDAEKVTELYNMSSEEIKPYLSQNQDEIDQLKTERLKLEKGITAYNQGVPDPYGLVKTHDDVLEAEDRVDELEVQIKELEKSSKIAYTTSDGQNITWQDLYDTKKEEEEFNALYAKYSANDDWEKNSKYITTNKKGTARSNSIIDSSVDWEYEDINKYDMYITASGESPDNGYAKVTTDEEKAIFNYIYHTEGKEAALKWHKSREGIYKDRAEQKQIEYITEFSDKFPVLSSFGSVLTNFASGVEYIGDTLNYIGTGELDDNHLANVTSAIRGTVSEKINWEIAGWDAGAFVYNTGMSMADSFASQFMLGKFGGISLGLSAAASATNDALSRGMDNGQAFWSGLSAGVFEGLFESWSIGKFKSLQAGFSSSGKQIIKNIASSMLVNASEETLTEIANIAYDYFANGDFSQYETSIRAYMASGMSESEARSKVASELAAQVGEAAGSGALMGLGFGGYAETSNAIGSTIKGAQIKNASKAGNLQVSDLVDIGKSLGEGTESYKLANKITDKSSAYAIGTLYGIEGIEISEANRADIVKSLERKGYDTATASSIADIMLDSKSDKFASVALQNPQTFSDIILNPKSTVSQRTRAYDGVAQSVEAYQEAKKNGKKNATTEASVEKLAKEYEAKGLSPAEAKAVAEKQLADAGAVQSSPTAETAVESKYEVADDGKTTNIKTGKEVKVNKIESISSSGEANLTLDDGMVVNASDIAFSTPAEAMFIETIGAMKLGKNPISVSSANALYQNAMTALKVNPKMTASEAFSLIKGLEESYVFGAYNFSRSELSARNEDGTAKRYAGELSQSQRASAYELGKKDSISKADAEQKAIDEKVGKTKPQASKKTSGKIVYEGGINVDKKSLTKTQQAHLEGIKLLAALTNYEIHVFKSEKVGKTYKYTMPDGTVVSANGWYRVGTNEIWIDLNAGNFGEGIMLETAGHEIGHDIKRKSPKQWKAIADLVMKTFAENNVDTEAMLKKQAKKVKRKYEASNKDMPSEAQILDEAYEEMVCDALSGMLIDGSIVNFIAEVKAKDKNLAQRILDAIKNLLAKWGLIIDDYKGRKLSAPEAQALAQFEDAFKQIQALYRDALMDTDAVNAALQKNTTDDGDVKFMERFEEDKYYSRQIDKWDSLKDGSYIKVGNIKENSPLNTVGMPSGNLYFDVTKIKTELEKHGDHLTTDTLKDIPKLLANPIAITEYNPGKGTNTVSVYGNLYYNGVPVVVGIVATLGRGNNIITKIRTTHARGDFRTQITDDSILYLNENKKETNSWFQAQEHHVPMGGNKYGFIRSITLVDQNVKENSENLFSERDTDIETQINQSMTMDEAKQMVQRAFVLGGIQEWYDGEYKNGDEWLKAQGADEVALYIENEYALQEKHLNKIQGIINDEFYVADVLEAYLEGTLIGKEKPKAKRLDVSVNHRVNDTRFYSPQRIENIKQLFDVATQKLTAKNRAEVTSARAKVLLFAHNSGASELLGLSQAELNKKLRSWSGYSAGAREASERLNRGVADSNKWTGIENCSWLYKNQVTTEELESLVKNVEGAASDYEKLYIARTMLALDTHIDWSWLSFEFDTFANVNKKQVGIGRCNGFYRNDERKIVVSHNKPHTVAHEMGHALDYQWGRDLGFSNSALTDTYRNTERITDADTKQFFDNFKIFLDSLTDNGDIRSEYTQDPKEVFARFVARFVQWVDNTGGNRTYNTETDYYNDKFTASNYIEFVKLLQEKAMLDAKKMENETNENVLFSDRDSEGNQLSEGQQEYFKDSKVRDANGNLLVMYHGTDSYNEFTVFKKGKSGYLGSGIYLTSDKSYAERYAKKNGYDGRVYKTYVNITNPLVVTTDQPAVEILGEKVAQKRGLKNSFSTTWITPSDIKKLQNKGYDGIVWEYAGSVEVSVWDSNQVKNTTNLDPTTDPDIRYSDRDSQGHKLSKEQVEYFKDSKTRDEKGRLLAVYHGTKSAGFTRFTKTDEIGYFFARSLKTAQTYSNNSKVVYTPDRYTDTDVPNEANYQVYLNIKKPYIIDGKGANWNGLESTGEKVHLSIKTSYWGDDGKGLGKIVFKYGGKTYSEIVHNVNEFDLFISKHTNPQLAFACAVEMNAIADKNGKGKFEVDLIWDFKKRGNADSKNTRDIVRRAYNSKWDYDGVIFKNVVDSGNGTKIKADDLYVAFNSNQIKSTANTEPTSDPDIRYQERDVAPITSEDLTRLEKHFGTTGNFRAAGYLLTNGKLLDFSGKHWGDTTSRMRQVDHRDAQEVLDDRGDNGVGAMVDMIGNGNIRLMPETGGINLAVYPNEKQRRVLSQYINYMLNTEGQIVIDYDDVGGDTVYSKEYGKTATSRQILNDIRNYFNGGRQSELMQFHTMFQERDPESSNRYILANSLETAAQNDVERRKLAEYKDKISLIEAEEGKLAEIQKKLFTKDAVEPTERKALQFEAKQISNRINTYDRQLLNLEATTALKNVLNREKALAAKRQKQKDNEALKKYKEKVAETQRELMTRYQDSRKRATESRHKTEMRHKIQKVVSELNQLLLKGSKERNVKLGLQDSVAKALEAINMDTVGADERVAKYNDLIAKAKDPDVIASLTETRDRIAAQGDRLSDKLEAMRKAYAEIRNNSKEYAPYYQQEAQLIEAAIEKTIDKVGDTSIRNMTLEQLEAVYDMYKVVLQTIRYANELHNEGKVEELRDNASAMMTELEKIKPLKEERAAIGDLIREFTWNEMTPIYAIRRTGSKTLEKFYWEMIRGQNTYAQDLAEANEFKAAIREKYGHSKWNLNKVYSFELKDGRTFRLTLEHMMSIYAYSKRPQAIDHMSVGGFFFNDKATFRRKGGLLKMIKSNEAGYTVDVEMLNTIKDEMEKVAKGSTKYVDEMQDYLTKMGNKGNEVSRVVWGIDIFKEKIYFPLKSVKDFIFQANQPSQETSLKHDGMTKETKPGASNPIVLESFDDVWAGHVERMSQYHGFVIPIDNMNKLLNYGSWAGTDSISVSTMLRARFGDAVNEYFNQFIKDMNGASSASGAKNPFFSMVGKFKKTAVAASMSVVAQQPTAILRAAAVLDSRYFIGLPEAHLLSTKWSELKRYAPIAIIKDIGGFDAGGGRQVAEWLNSDARRGADKVLGKIDDITMWGAAVGDQVGWCAIWEAVKRETKAKHKNLEVGSEAFLKIAGERFTEVIVLTQVYDSTLSRSGYMRSKHDSVKMLTAFMGEPTVSINMQFDALLQAKRGTITKRKAGRILGATYAATIAASIAASLIYALRDDDEDESYLEKFAEAFGEKLIGDINPLNQLPAVRDIISIFEGWDVERTDMAVFKDIKDAFDGLFSENKSTWRKVEDFAGAVASIFGVPLKNLLRTGREIYNGYNDIFDGIEPKDVDDAFARGIKGEKRDKSKALYDAIVSGDEARIEVYRNQYEDDKAYETALRKALRENDPRIKEAAEARYKGNVDKYMRIVKDIKGERNFSQDTIVAAINAEINSMKPKSKSEISSPAYITVDDYYNSIVNGDTSTARTIKDKLVAEKVEQGYLQSEAEDSIATSFTSQVKSEYMDGNIKRSKAVDLINEYGNSESGAETEIKKCDFELEYGFSWSERARAYRLGKISASELKYAVMDIEGEDWQGAEDYIKFLNLEMANPNLDITASDAKGYFEYAEPAGINIEVYLSYKEKTSGLQGDKDANGKTISGSKKNKVLAVINSLPITYAQKDALYYMNGWSAKTINEAPWH